MPSQNREEVAGVRIRTGCDLVHIPKFEQSTRGGSLARLFTPYELSQNLPLTTLAGWFAAKEAVIKALDLSGGSFLTMEIVKGESGRPAVRFAESDTKIMHHDLSISHDGEYAMATAVFHLRM